MWNLEPVINRVAESDEIYRERVIEGAYSCFEQHGFDKTTAGDIIDRSGVSRARFYQLFSNKEAVIIQICRREIDAYSDKVDGLWNQKNKSTEDILVERVYRVLREVQKNMYMRYIMESPGYTKLIMDSVRSESTVYSLLKNRWERAYQPLIDRSRNTAISLDDIICWLSYSQIVLLKLMDATELSDAKLKKFIREFVAIPLTQTLEAS